MDLLTSCN